MRPPRRRCLRGASSGCWVISLVKIRQALCFLSGQFCYVVFRTCAGLLSVFTFPEIQPWTAAAGVSVRGAASPWGSILRLCLRKVGRKAGFRVT